MSLWIWLDLFIIGAFLLIIGGNLAFNSNHVEAGRETENPIYDLISQAGMLIAVYSILNIITRLEKHIKKDHVKQSL
jgi:hypothetical protein